MVLIHILGFFFFKMVTAKIFFAFGITLLYLQELKESNIPLENVRICYSPFSRTTHTAEVVASVLDLPFEGPQCKVSYSIP